MRAQDSDRLDGSRTTAETVALGVRSIVTPYALLAALWIVLSDWLVLRLFAEPPSIAAAETIKGLLFVALTTALLNGLIGRFTREISAARAAGARMRPTEALARIAAVYPGAIGILRIGPDGGATFPFASAAIVEIYGVPPEQLARDASAAWAAIHPDDTDRLDRETRESARTLQPQRSEFRVRHPAKGEIWVSIHAMPERTADGATQWLGTANDISERKRTEEALRESERKYHMLFETMTQGAFVQRADGALIDVNPAALELFGLERDDFLSRNSHCPSWKVIREDGSDLPGEEHPSMVALRTGESISNRVAGVFNPRRNGFVWMVINAIPQFRAGEPRPHEVFVTLHDVTARRQAEEALRHSEERMRLAMDTAPIGTWDWDIASGAVYWSENLWQIFGREGAPEPLNFESVTRSIHPEDRERVQTAMHRTLTSDAAYRLDMRFVKPDGSIRWALSHGRVIRDEAGKPVRMVGVDLDITELKTSQAALDDARRHIESLAAQVLTAQEEERARLSRELHDEIGQSATALKLLLDTALRTETRAAADSPVAAALRIADSLIEQTRDISRRLRPPQLDDLGLAASLRWHLARIAVPESLSVELDDRIGDARFAPAVELACFRIVQEALSNVLRHARATSVKVSLVRESDRLELAVRDDGVGFEPEAIPAAERAESLGLLGMRERVAALGGAFAVRSVAGSGTEISAVFPLQGRN